MFGNSPTDLRQDVLQYGYPANHNCHYVSDSGSNTGGDDVTLWYNSPSRSDSSSPNNLQNSMASAYEIYSRSAQNTYSSHQPVYSTIKSDSGFSTHHTGSYIRVVKRRTTANKKERRRTHSINNAFFFLRNCIPNVPADTKLSKIKTLRLATSYISYLTRALETDETVGGFKAELGTVCRKSNSKPVHASDSTADQSSPRSDTKEDTSNAKKSKGRTGWPQHVWALELKQEHQPL